MEWIRKEANFKYFDKDNQDNNIIIRNEEDLVEEFYKYSHQFLCSGNIIIDNMINSYSNGVKDMWFFSLIYLYRQSLELILIQRNLNRLPRTEEFFNNNIESLEEVQLRRVKWAIKELAKEGNVKEWDVIIKAGLSKNFYSKLKECIQQLMEK